MFIDRNTVSDFDSHLTVEEQEILCSLPLNSGTSASLHQKKLAAKLSQIFKEGKKDLASDKWKAAAYGNYTHASPLPRTITVFNTLGVFTSTRLALVRTNRLTNLGFKFLFTLGSLSYLLELITDIGIIFKSTFFPRTQTEKNLSHWQRFKNILKKDNRPLRMANAAVWFSINLTCVLLTGGILFYLNVAGFIFDCAVEIYKNTSLNSHTKLLNKINCKLDKINNKIDYLLNPAFVTKNPDWYEKNKLSTDKQLDNTLKKLYAERDTLLTYQTNLEIKIKEEKRKRRFNAVMNILCCAGSTLFLLALVANPPTGLLIAGAVIALVTGSILTGLAPRLIKYFNRVSKILYAKLTDWLDKSREIKTLEIEKQPLLDKHSNSSSRTVIAAATSEPPSPVEAPKRVILRRQSEPANCSLFAKKKSIREFPYVILTDGRGAESKKAYHSGV